MVPNFELKLKARAALKNNWQTALMVALIAALPSLVSQVVSIMTQSGMMQVYNSLMAAMQSNADTTDLLRLIEEGFSAERLMPSVLTGLVSGLLSPFLTLGMLNYTFKLLRGEQDIPISTVFSRKDCFFKAIGLNLMVALRTFLWMLPGLAMELMALALLPALVDSSFYFIVTLLMTAGPIVMLVLGIRAALHYAMAPRFMAETPSMGVNQCIRASVGMMRYRKMLLFSLEISFVLLQFGISLLETLLLGLFGPVLASTLSMALSFVLNVYIQTAVSVFYLVYRQPVAI